MSCPRVIGLALLLITLLVYFPVTHDAFLNYDDTDYVTENQAVQNGLTWKGVKWAFSTGHASNWHPVTWLSHMTDCELFRLNPAGHHLVNILFHAANTFLLFILLLRLKGARWPCIFIAALFAWHPLHVESVAWVSERKDVLSTFFALLALLSYVRQVKENRRHHFWVPLIFFALSLMSKPMLVTLPLVMMLLDYWPLQRIHTSTSEIGNLKHCFFEKWPFFLLALGSSIITFLAQRNEAVASLAKVPLSLRFENVPTAYVDYLGKMVWPARLAVFYPLSREIAWPVVAFSTGFLVLICALVWLERKPQPYLLVGWLWFLGTLVPVIGLIQVGDQAMADRYSYFPLIGIFIAATFAIDGWANAFRLSKIPLAIMGFLTLATCLILTEKQLRYWHDSESLFTHAIAVTENNALAHLNLGAALEANGKPDEALAQYREALRLEPHRYEADNNIGKLFYEMNQPEKALDYCLKAVQLNPKRATLHNSLGLVLVALDRWNEAMSQFSEASQLDPGYAPPVFQMGRIRLRQGRDVQAISYFQEALEIDPDNYQMLIYIARVLAADENPQIRNAAEACTLAGRALQLNGTAQFVTLDTLAMARAEAGHFDEAVQLQQRAVVLAEDAGQKDDVVLLQQRLQLYRQQKPWRESFQTN